MARRPAAQELDAPVLRVVASHPAQGHEQPLAVLRPQMESVARRTDVNQQVLLAVAALPDLREAEHTSLEAPHAVSLTLPGRRNSELHFEQRRDEPAIACLAAPRCRRKWMPWPVFPQCRRRRLAAPNDQQPAAVFNPAPPYPASALAARQTGRVLIRVVTDLPRMGDDGDGAPLQWRDLFGRSSVGRRPSVAISSGHEERPKPWSTVRLCPCGLCCGVLMAYQVTFTPP